MLCMQPKAPEKYSLKDSYWLVKRFPYIKVILPRRISTHIYYKYQLKKHGHGFEKSIKNTFMIDKDIKYNLFSKC